MGFAVTRLRAAASAGVVVATLFAFTPVASAAPAAPSDGLSSALIPAITSPADRFVGDLMSLPDLSVADSLPPDLLPEIGIPSAELPASLLPTGSPSAILDLFAPTGLFAATQLRLASKAIAAPATVAARVIADARSHLGAPWVYGTQGPRAFDCSGLVLRAYSDVGVVNKLGGWGNRSGYALMAYGRAHHLVSTSNGKPGDVVVWGGGGHVGIYLGNGMAISALMSGVRIHGIYAVTKRFTAFIHTGLAGVATAATPAVTTKVVSPPSAASSARAAAAAKASAAARAAATKATRFTTVAAVLRAAAGTSARSVRILSSGTRLIVLHSLRDSQKRVWYQVKAGGTTGWIAGWLTRT